MANKSVSYADYLKLDSLLTSQLPESVAAGREAHDEMLFIIVHQVYELWFKQVLVEIDRIEKIFGGDWVDDRDVASATNGLARIVEHLVRQAAFDDVAVAHHHDPVRQQPSDRKVVGDDDHGKSEIGDQSVMPVHCAMMIPANQIHSVPISAISAELR